MYEDKTLVCRNCGAEFTFTAGEQEFYAEKGFENEPKMCKDCRRKKKASSITQLYAHPAAKRQRFPSSPMMTVRFTVASASLSREANNSSFGADPTRVSTFFVYLTNS